MQCQLFCTGRAYCDFILWTCSDIHIERIYPDEAFWSQCVSKANIFFVNAILPELIGKWLSRPSASSTSSLPSDASTIMSDASSTNSDATAISSNAPTGSDACVEAERYCYCEGPESGKMIACDNSTCPYKWFHFKCLKLTDPPRCKKWFCPKCRKLPHCSKKKKKE